MSLLRDIQKTAVDSNVDLASVLRKCKILAARLGHAPFKTWVDKELDGYASEQELPEYRIIRNVESIGDFSIFGGLMTNAPINLAFLPEDLRGMVSTVHLLDGVSSYTELLRNGAGGNLGQAWSSGFVEMWAGKIYVGMTLLRARQVIPASAVFRLRDTVRNRVLNFVLEIEAEAPNAGEAEPGERPLPLERVAQVFHTNIWGGQNVVAAGTDFTQAVESVFGEIRKGDYESLRRYLVGTGLADSDVDELAEAIEADGVPKESGKLGSRVSSWIGRMCAKAASGAWNVSMSVAGTLLAKVMAAHYGLDQTLGGKP